uniref:non-specific serine/threonine protein kinase n=1 Tax=Trypanosoma congolense (strain IL3000) TaxID=1068625 RepID=G0UZ75_TRYCI|nr:putative protein kinase [Trypanosoma congolense IL3000]
MSCGSSTQYEHAAPCSPTRRVEKAAAGGTAEGAFRSLEGDDQDLVAAATSRRGGGVPPTEGQQILLIRDFDRLYKVRRYLGGGGYSVVFEVINRHTRERKAAKFVVGKEARRNARARLGCPVEHKSNEELNGMEWKDYSGGSCVIKPHIVNSHPVISDTLMKEVAIAFMTNHQNLVRTNEVFVHDVDDMYRRLIDYAPQLSIAAPHTVKDSSSLSDLRDIGCRVGSSRQWRRSKRGKHTSDGDTGSPNVSTSPKSAPNVREGVKKKDSNLQALWVLKRQLQEGSLHCILVMDLLKGKDLFSTVARGPLEEKVVAGYMFDLFLALKYLHGHGIVHRDVKVENMVLDEHGSVRLIDYGFCEILPKASKRTNDAKVSGNSTGPLTQFCGSHHYVAPEVIRSSWLARQMSKANEEGGDNGVNLPPIGHAGVAGAATQMEDGDGEAVGRQVGASSGSLRTLLARRGIGYGVTADIWSAGIVMFVLLHSAFPYHDERRSRLLKLITSNKRTPVISSHLSPEAKDLLCKLLTHDPRHRPSVNEVVRHGWFSKHLGESVTKGLLSVA